MSDSIYGRIPVRGPVNTRRLKADLQNIADSLLLDSTGTVKDLVPRINAHIAIAENQAKIMTIGNLQGLLSYKASSISAQSGSKNSLDKATEDALQDVAQSNQEATG